MSSQGHSHPALRADGANTILTIMSYLRLTSSKNAFTNGAGIFTRHGVPYATIQVVLRRLVTQYRDTPPGARVDKRFPYPNRKLARSPANGALEFKDSLAIGTNLSGVCGRWHYLVCG
ncbi:hypothetical protein CGLO_07938 [Colletotrichum gloeosporioides Cg-14]|uniref:Uncharacterized protein n=1 Tax=Colletotrichum gloeosporioides (strain Cg-14) TaxID=1237896 RepID=T0KI08_COLGC|nr:hypothetical protein CGLO_07938 [Colletotrichum gloeosporioides Cg-14]